MGVLLVVALDRQGRMLATSETPKWQGGTSTSHLHVNAVLFSKILSCLSSAAIGQNGWDSASPHEWVLPLEQL